MPTTSGSKKALRNQERKRKHNLKKKRAMKEALKKLERLVEADKYDEANEYLPEVYKAIDKAAKRNIIKENKAARKKSQASEMAKEPAK